MHHITVKMVPPHIGYMSYSTYVTCLFGHGKIWNFNEKINMFIILFYEDGKAEDETYAILSNNCHKLWYAADSFRKRQTTCVNQHISFEPCSFSIHNFWNIVYRKINLQIGYISEIMLVCLCCWDQRDNWWMNGITKLFPPKFRGFLYVYCWPFTSHWYNIVFLRWFFVVSLAEKLQLRWL